MRNRTYSATAKHDFLRYLNGIVRYPLMHFDDSPVLSSSVFSSTYHRMCSPIQYHYTYLYTVIDAKTVRLLDDEISKLVNTSPTIYIDPTKTADAFYKTLSESNYLLPSNETRLPSVQEPTYHFLVYDPVSVSSQYGYRIEVAGPALGIGLASSYRFAFVDAGLRPFLLDEASDLTSGEILTSASRSAFDYANILHGIISSCVTPPVSKAMRHVPDEFRISFHLNIVDTSTLISEDLTNINSSDITLPLASSFNASDFLSSLRVAFHRASTQNKVLSLHVEHVNVSQDAIVAMAVTRALSRNSLHLTLDGHMLLNDITNEVRHFSYYIDSSLTIHIPLFLFSFSDPSRMAQLRMLNDFRESSVVGKMAIFIVENRFRKFSRNKVSTTTEAVAKVLLLLCGLQDDIVKHANVKKNVIPFLLKDQIRRNLLVDQVDWSDKAASKAHELLNFEGLDKRFIPHNYGSRINESRQLVLSKLQNLHDLWHRSSVNLSFVGIESASSQLMKACEQLAAQLHAEFCHQPLPEEILLRAEAGAESEKPSQSVFTLGTILLPILCGICAALFTSKQISTRRPEQPLPITSEQKETVTWFSTLSSGRSMDKTKTS